ncbi:MAG: CpaF family protein, partial [Rhizobiales bacterium]|nr:CpaF family protein [Hyphomicrobiales bacterium]
MFGKRTDDVQSTAGIPLVGQPGAVPAALAAPASAIPDLPLPSSGGFGAQSARGGNGNAKPAPNAPQRKAENIHSNHKSENYYDIKSTIFNALIDAIDLTQLGQLDRDAARDEIRDIVNEIITLKDVVMSIAEQEELLEDICNDVLGYGPLEPLLARDDISDIMVNGSQKCYIEVGGTVTLTNVRFRDDSHLMNVCQRIVSQVGRRVDESSPICDARLPDGSRVNVIAPPLAIDGA